MTRPILLSLVAAALLTAETQAQRIAPPPPASYDVQCRYRIRVGRNERIVQFREMVRYFESIGYVMPARPVFGMTSSSSWTRTAGTWRPRGVAEVACNLHPRSYSMHRPLLRGATIVTA